MRSAASAPPPPIPDRQCRRRYEATASPRHPATPGASRAARRQERERQEQEQQELQRQEQRRQRDARLLGIYGMTHAQMSDARKERVAQHSGPRADDGAAAQAVADKADAASVSAAAAAAAAAMATATTADTTAPLLRGNSENKPGSSQFDLRPRDKSKEVGSGHFRLKHHSQTQRIAATVQDMHSLGLSPKLAPAARSTGGAFPKSSPAPVTRVQQAPRTPRTPRAAREPLTPRAAPPTLTPQQPPLLLHTDLLALTRSPARASAAATSAPSTSAMLDWLRGYRLAECQPLLQELGHRSPSSLLALSDAALKLLLRQMLAGGATPTHTKSLRQAVVQCRLKGSFALDKKAALAAGSGTGTATDEPERAERAALLLATSMVHDATGAQPKALACLERSLALQRQLTSTCGPAMVAVTLHMMGMVHEEMGDPAAQAVATKLFNQARAARRCISSGDEVYAVVSACLHSLGCLLDAQGDHSLSLQHLKEAVEDKQKLSAAASTPQKPRQKPKPSKQSTLVRCELAVFEAMLGLVHFAAADADEALVHLQRAAGMCAGVGVSELMHALVAECRHTVGVLHAERGEYAAAEEQLELALATRRLVHSADAVHSVISAMLGAAGVLLDAGAERSERCPVEPYLHSGVVWYLEHMLAAEKKHEVQDQTQSPGAALADHADIVPTLLAMGGVHLAKPTPDAGAAFRLFSEAVRVLERIFGSGAARPDAALGLQQAGMSLDLLGRHDEALGYLDRALSMHTELYGEGTLRPDTATTLHAKGAACAALRRHGDAMAALSRALAMRRAMAGAARFIGRLSTTARQRRRRKQQQQEQGSPAGEGGGGSGCDGTAGEEEEQEQEGGGMQQRDAALACAVTLHVMGMSQQAAGEYDEALGSLSEALRIKRRWLLLREAEVAGQQAQPSSPKQQQQQQQQQQPEGGDEDEHKGGAGAAWKAAATSAATSAAGAFADSIAWHPEVATTLHQIGLVQHARGDHQGALRCLRESLRMDRAAWQQAAHGSAPTSAEQRRAISAKIATTLYLVGIELQAVGDMQDALAHYERSIATQRELLSAAAAHPGGEGSGSAAGGASEARARQQRQLLASALQASGGAMLRVGEHQRAREQLLEAVNLKVSEVGGGDGGIYGLAASPDTARLLHQLGAVASALGERDEALQFLRRALEVCQEVYGRHAVNQPVINTVHTIAQVLQKERDFEGALFNLRQVLDMKKAMLGGGPGGGGRGGGESRGDEAAEGSDGAAAGEVRPHASIAATLHEIGLVEANRGDTEVALRFLGQSLAMDWQLHGHHACRHEIAATLYQMGILHNMKGDPGLALRYCTQSLDMDRKLYGAGVDHTDVAATLHSVGLLLNTTGKYSTGLQHLQECLAMKRRLHPRAGAGEDEHPSIVATDQAIATMMLEAATLDGMATTGSRAKRKIVDDERSGRCIIS